VSIPLPSRVVIDGTNLTARDREAWIISSGLRFSEAAVVYLHCAPEVCKNRVRDRKEHPAAATFATRGDDVVDTLHKALQEPNPGKEPFKAVLRVSAQRSLDIELVREELLKPAPNVGKLQEKFGSNKVGGEFPASGPEYFCTYPYFSSYTAFSSYGPSLGICTYCNTRAAWVACEQCSCKSCLSEGCPSTHACGTFV